MSIITTLVAVLVTAFVHAAPTPATTTIPHPQSEPTLNPLSEPAFVPSPKGRGTTDLLFTCILTLTICVWTAIHPNILPNPTLARRLRYKAQYVLLGIFSPEIVLAVAFNEWREARKVLRAWESAAEISISKENAESASDFLAKEKKWENEADIAKLEGPLGILKDAIEKAKNPENVEQAFTAVTELRTSLQSYKASGNVLVAAKRSGVHGLIRRGIERIQASLLITWFKSMFEERHFGMEGAFFAVMGGYTFCPVDNYTHPEYERTLSHDGLILLLQKGLIDPIRFAKLKDEILDKGKADMLAKLLVCMQALWMMFNCLSRKIAGLPITIIELNVVVHVLCAVSVYACWWKKPHDAGRALSLSPGFLDQSSSTLAFVMDKACKCKVMVSQQVPGEQIVISEGRATRTTQGPPASPPETTSPDTRTESKNTPFYRPGASQSVNTEQENGTTYPRTSHNVDVRREKENNNLNQPTTGSNFDQLPIPTFETPVENIAAGHPTTEAAPAPTFQLLHHYKRSYRRYSHDSHEVTLIVENVPKGVEHRIPGDRDIELDDMRVLVFCEEGYIIATGFSGGMGKVSLTDTDLLIFKNAAQLMREENHAQLTMPAEPKLGLEHFYPIAPLDTHMSAKPSRITTDEIAKVLIPLCLIYGGVHASLWNSYFPSPLERLLWRVSCLLVAVPGPGVLAIKATRAVKLRRYTGCPGAMEGMVGLVWLFLLGVPGGLIYGVIQAQIRLPKTPAYIFLLVIIYAVSLLLVASFLLLWGALSRLIYKEFLEVVIPMLKFFTFIPLTVAYCAARVFILVETFICLRSLPYGAFQTVIWDDIWPHL